MNSQLKFDLNLQQLSTIRLAIDLWEQPSMKKKIKPHITVETLNAHRTFQKSKNSWDRELLEGIKNKKLSNVVKNDLSYVIKPIGDRLFHYLKNHAQEYHHEEIINNAKPDTTYPSLSDYYEKIKWTTIGTIDEAGTFANIFYGIPDDEIVNMPDLFFEACKFCNKKCIKAIWNKCTNAERKLITTKLESTEASSIYQYWKRHVYGKKSNAYKQALSISNLAAFKTSVEFNHIEAVKYLMNELNQREKNDVLTPTAESLIEKYARISQTPRIYGASAIFEMVDMLIYVIQNMLEKQKDAFLKKHNETILNILINEWPWRYLFLDTLEFNLQNLTKQQYNGLMMNLIRVIIEEYDCLGSSEPTGMWILVEAWTKCPENLRKSIFETCWLSSEPLVFKLKATALINSIIDDEIIEPIRKLYIDGFNKSCNKLLMSGDVEVVDKYMKNFLTTDEERETFVKRFKTKNICRHLIVKQSFDQADKFLNWICKNKNERKKLKDELKNGDFFVTILCRTWEKNRHLNELEIRLASEKLFKWLNITSNELTGLKEIMKKNIQFKVYLKKYLTKISLGFRAFLSSCSFTNDEIEILSKSVNQKKKE